MRAWIAGVVLGLCAAWASAASAQSCATYPYALHNGTTADADQVMADLNCAALAGAARFTGNVGIGVTNPTANLEVLGAGNTFASVRSPNANFAEYVLGDATGPRWEFRRLPSNDFDLYQSDVATRFTILRDGKTGIGTPTPTVNLEVMGPDNTFAAVRSPNINYAEYLLSDETGPRWELRKLPSADFDIFQSNIGSRVTILSTGNVGIGTTTPTLTFYVNGTAGGTGAWINASDARLKTGIVEIPDALGLVQKLRGVRFQWRADAQRSVGQTLNLPAGETEIGLVAQEVAEVVPEAVAKPTTPDGVYGLKEASLVAVLVEAVKEQQAEIGELREAVAALQRQAAGARTTAAGN